MATLEAVYDTIPSVEMITPEEFLRHHIRRNQPLLMRGMMNDWPAMHKWSFDFFSQLSTPREVVVEEGNVMQQSASFQKISFAQYVRQLQESDEQQQFDTKGNRRAYLSVFRIFQAFPELRQDVDFSILSRFKLKNTVSGWLGPAGTVTGFHIDWGDNILAQIHGRKLIHLASPADSRFMYRSSKFDEGTTASEVDFENWDEAKHPLFRQARIIEVTLHPGEMLFIPRGWWHHVRSLDGSISVSSLGYDLRGLLFDAIPHRGLRLLHDRGLFNRECTCHVIRDGKWTRK